MNTVTLMASESQKEIRKRVGLKNVFEKVMPENSPNLAKDINLQSRNLSKLQQVKPKEIHTKIHISQMSEN